MKSTEQMLRNPDIAPSSDVIAKALGEANNAYIKFINEIASHDIQIDWRYYNDGKAWLAKGLFKWRGVRGGQNETTIFWLSIWDGFFKVTIYIPEKARAEVLSLPLDSEVNILEFPSKFDEGECKIIPLVVNYRSNSDIVDFYNEWMATTDGARFRFRWNKFRYDKTIEPHAKSVLKSPAVVKLAPGCTAPAQGNSCDCVWSYRQDRLPACTVCTGDHLRRPCEWLSVTTVGTARSSIPGKPLFRDGWVWLSLRQPSWA